MSNPRHVWPYWSVDLPGLTEVSAKRLLAWAEDEDIALGGIAVDPAVAFSIHMDRETVAAVLAALRAALVANALPPDKADAACGFADQLAEWMSEP